MRPSVHPEDKSWHLQKQRMKQKAAPGFPQPTEYRRRLNWRQRQTFDPPACLEITGSFTDSQNRNQTFHSLKTNEAIQHFVRIPEVPHKVQTEPWVGIREDISVCLHQKKQTIFFFFHRFSGSGQTFAMKNSVFLFLNAWRFFVGLSATSSPSQPWSALMLLTWRSTWTRPPLHTHSVV